MVDEHKKEEPPPQKSVRLPALFATIHFRSERRPNGYTDEEITELNELANRKDEGDDEAP